MYFQTKSSFLSQNVALAPLTGPPDCLRQLIPTKRGNQPSLYPFLEPTILIHISPSPMYAWCHFVITRIQIQIDALKKYKSKIQTTHWQKRARPESTAFRYCKTVFSYFLILWVLGIYSGKWRNYTSARLGSG